MKFMTMVKSSEGQGMPPPSLFGAIAKLGEEGATAGVFVRTGGLSPTANGARVELRGGQISVSDGPFSEAKEVIGGYAFYEVQTKEEAVEWSIRFMELHKALARLGRRGRSAPGRGRLRSTAWPARRPGQAQRPSPGGQSGPFLPAPPPESRSRKDHKWPRRASPTST
jgi:hypothetical protein